MPSLSSSIATLRASVFAELQPLLDARAAQGLSIAPLHIGDTHLAPPTAARFAHEAQTESDGSLHRYGNIAGEPSLRRALAHYNAQQGRGEYHPDTELLVSAGATHGLFCAARAVLSPGDEVLVLSPYWPLSVGVLTSANAVPVEVALTQALYADRAMDLSAVLAQHRTSRTRALYVTSPNNPDGYCYTAAQRRALADFAIAHDLWVLSDEVYADYSYTGAHGSLADEAQMRERTLRVFSFSKSHALAGARVGAVLGPRDAIAAARRVSTHTVYNVPVISQRVCANALTEGSLWVAHARAQYLEACAIAVEAMSNTEIDFFVPDGGAYLFLDCTRVLRGRSLRALLSRAIERGVLLAPGAAFGEGFERHARLCFTSVDPAALRSALGSLREAIAHLSSTP